MLNEIRAIDNDLDRHINENNKKQIALKNKTEELSKAIDTSRNESKYKLNYQTIEEKFDILKMITLYQIRLDQIVSQI